MKPEARRLLTKAGRAIRAAEVLLDAGLRFRKHSAVHAAFGERYSRTGVLDPRYHRWLLDAFDRRIASDYETEGTISPHEVRTAISQASEFLAAARHLLEPQ